MGKRGPKAGTPAARRGGEACKRKMDTDYYRRIGSKGRETQAARRQQAQSLPFSPQAAPAPMSYGDVFSDPMAHHRRVIESLRVVQRADAGLRRSFDFALSQLLAHGSPEDKRNAHAVKVYEAAMREMDDSTPGDAA